MERRAALTVAERPIDVVFHPEDFDPDYARGESGSSNLAKIFEDVVGREDVVEKMQHLQEVVWAYRRNGIDPADQIPTNFVFSGPPGKPYLRKRTSFIDTPIRHRKDNHCPKNWSGVL